MPIQLHGRRINAACLPVGSGNCWLWHRYDFIFGLPIIRELLCFPSYYHIYEPTLFVFKDWWLRWRLIYDQFSPYSLERPVPDSNRKQWWFDQTVTMGVTEFPYPLASHTNENHHPVKQQPIFTIKDSMTKFLLCIFRKVSPTNRTLGSVCS